MDNEEVNRTSTETQLNPLERLGRVLTGTFAFLSALFSHLLVPLAAFEIVYLLREEIASLPSVIFISITLLAALIMGYLVWIIPMLFSIYSTALLSIPLKAEDWDSAYLLTLSGIIVALAGLSLITATTMWGVEPTFISSVFPSQIPGYNASPIITLLIWSFFVGPMALLSLTGYRNSFNLDSGASREEDSHHGEDKRMKSESRVDQLNMKAGNGEVNEEKVRSFSWSTPPTTTFADVGNYEGTLREIRQSVIRPLVTDQESYDRFGVTPARGILLHGPPGTGKTHIARAIAGELGYPYVELSGGDLKSKWLNESTQNVATLFRETKQFDECVIFVDEIDSLLADRSDSLHQEHAQVVNEFLAQLDADDPGFVFIAATNRLEHLDAAATRRGRFDEQFEIGLPDYDARIEILQILLRDRPTDLADEDLGTIAAETDGASGADLAGIVDDASRRAAEADAEALTMRHILSAIETR